ncbi:MAG: hypothetical protein ABI680_07410 [Chthoniobacteraceae bacterium]
MNLRWLLPIATAGVSFTLGYLWGNDPRHASSHRSRATDLHATQSDESTSGPKVETPAERGAKIIEAMRQNCAHASSVTRRSGFAKLFAGMSEEDLDLAAKAIGDLPAFARTEAREMMVLRLVALSPERAIQFVEKDLGETGNLAILLQSEWGKTEPEQSLRWLAEILNAGAFGPNRADWALGDLASREPERAVALALAEPLLFGERALRTAFEKWSKTDPKAALNRAAGLTNMKLRSALFAATAQGWAAANPAAARAWFNGLQDPIAKEDAAPGLALGLAKTDFPAAMEIVSEMPDGRRKEIAVAGLAEVIRFQDKIDDALALAGSLPFDPKNEALMSFYLGMCHDRPGKTVGALLARSEAGQMDAREASDISDFLRRGFFRPSDQAPELAEAIARFTGPESVPLRTSLTETLVQSWAGKDATAALTWAATLPAGLIRETAFRTAAGSWAWNSATEASEWLEKLPNSPDRTAGIAGYANAQLGRDSEQVMKFIRSIPDPAERLATLQEGWQRWLKVNREEAEKWLESSAVLSASERVNLSAHKEEK